MSYHSPPHPPSLLPWQDGARSDSMDLVCDVMHLHGLFRKAVRLLRGMDVRVDSNTFQFAMFSVIPIFKVRFLVFISCLVVYHPLL